MRYIENCSKPEKQQPRLGENKYGPVIYPESKTRIPGLFKKKDRMRRQKCFWTGEMRPFFRLMRRVIS